MRTWKSNIKQCAVRVHVQNGHSKFTKRPENLHYYKPKHLSQQTKTLMVMTVGENKSLFNDRQVERAKKAQSIYHTLGWPTIQDRQVDRDKKAQSI
jgi:hypothetical protein